MKDLTCTALGVIGSAITTAFGGWSTGITTLIIFMAVDYITGLLCAGVFKVSKKTRTADLKAVSVGRVCAGRVLYFLLCW